MAKNEYEVQADKFMQETGTKLTIGEPTYGKHPLWDKNDDDRWNFPFTFSRVVNGKRRQFTETFGQSIAAGSKKPTAYDLLACLQKSDPGSFENFCGDFGYDTDSRKAERTYNAVCKEWENVDKLWHDVLDKLQEIA